jgi:hypothetical protein
MEQQQRLTGYAHYWQRPAVLDERAFARFVDDLRAIVETAQEHGFALAGHRGDGDPTLGPDRVALNGSRSCGHAERSLVSPWPTEDAAGVGREDGPIDSWFGGDLLTTRLCDGNCAMSPFRIDREVEEAVEDGPFWQRCITQFRPYDIVVTAALLMFKYRFGDAINLSSAGDVQHWYDGQHLCLLALGILPALPTLGGTPE